MTARAFIVGVDLGQVNDPTAIVALELRKVGNEFAFDLRHAERHLARPYTFIGERLKVLTDRLIPLGDVLLGFDQTGVGRAAADILHSAGLRVVPYGITITAGDTVRHDLKEFHVPKRDLVAALQVVLQNSRLRIAEKLPLKELIVRELLNFKVKVTAVANETFEAWRAGDHDDFVLAICIAVWLQVELHKSDGIFEFYSQGHAKQHERGAFRTRYVDAEGNRLDDCGNPTCEFRVRPPETSAPTPT